ncbi:hypothetical protein BDY24DRAFT_370554 [Mrakia frigida]|uniref:uncharacterized protein n=1 Tax=Mrakia frigida TaxID=29902 RepID=UPI003FCC1318
MSLAAELPKETDTSEGKTTTNERACRSIPFLPNFTILVLTHPLVPPTTSLSPDQVFLAQMTRRKVDLFSTRGLSFDQPRSCSFFPPFLHSCLPRLTSRAVSSRSLPCIASPSNIILLGFFRTETGDVARIKFLPPRSSARSHARRNFDLVGWDSRYVHRSLLSFEIGFVYSASAERSELRSFSRVMMDSRRRVPSSVPPLVLVSRTLVSYVGLYFAYLCSGVIDFFSLSLSDSTLFSYPSFERRVSSHLSLVVALIFSPRFFSHFVVG